MDIKDSYLHSSVGVVKSIDVNADKLTYTLADIANTTREVTLPLVTSEYNGIVPKITDTTTRATYDYKTLTVDSSGKLNWRLFPTTYRTYNTLEGIPNNGNTQAWYNILTILDNTNSPCIFIIKAYAHSSAIFTVSKGHGSSGNITLLNYVQNPNSNYAYIKGARLLSNGVVQVLLNIPKENTNQYVKINAAVYNTTGAKPNSTLVLYDSLPSDITVVDTKEFVTNSMMSNKFVGDLTGTATKANDSDKLGGIAPSGYVKSGYTTEPTNKLTYFSNGLKGTDLSYFSWKTPDGSYFTLIAKLDNWNTSTSSDYHLIGTFYGFRDGNQATTLIHNIVAQAVSWTNNTKCKLYITDKPTPGYIVPYIVSYTDSEGVTANYLALRTQGSNGNVCFIGYTKNLMEKAQWISLKIPSDQTLPENVTIVKNPNFTDAHQLTTNSYFDGTASYTLLHAGNYKSYVNATNFPGLAGVRSVTTGTANGTISVNTNGTSTNVAVKGLGSAAYTDSTVYAVRKKLTNEDLDTVTTPGFYNAGSDNTCANVPTGVTHFGMYVIHCASTSYYVQILFQNSYSDKQWRRHCRAGTWSDWILDELVDTKVTQTNTADNNQYRVLLSGNSHDTTETTTARKSTKLKFNPYTGTLESTYIYTKGLKSQAESLEDLMKSGNALAYNRFSKSTFTNETGITVSGNANGVLWVGTHGPEESNTSEIGYGHLLGFFGGNGSLYHKVVINGDTSKSWRQVAYTTSDITGNAATADKLKTSVKLWGQNFDGSADVNGSLSDVTSIRSKSDSVLDLITPSGSNKNIYLRYNNNDNTSVCLTGNGFMPASASNGKLTLGSSSNKWSTVYASTLTGNLDGQYVNKLTGYAKATAIGAIAATDSLNTALGKLEFKTDTVYTWYKGVTEDDTDTLVNKWGEIVDFLDSVKEGTDILDEFVTRKTFQEITAYKHFKNRVRIAGEDASLYLDSTSNFNTVAFSIMKTDATEATKSFLIMRDDSVFKIANHAWNVEHLLLHEGNTHIKNGVITIAGKTITPLTSHQSLANYVTLNTAQNITGLKTFKAASTKDALIGTALKLGNTGWVTGMQTAMDFYNGSSYKVPNARISVLMKGDGKAGGTMIFSTQTKHTSTNPNPNALTERFRIGDDSTATFSCNVNIRNTGSNALSGMTNASLMYDSYTSLNNTSYHPILGVKTNGGNVVNLGAYINGVGFFGYKNGRTENGWDWKFVFDSANGNLETTGGITLYTPEGDSPALTFRRGSIGSDTAVDWRMYITQGHLKIQNALNTVDGGAWRDVLHFAADQTNKLLTSSYHIIPASNDVLTLGSSSLKWNIVYATKFKGTADNATLFDNSSKDNFFIDRGVVDTNYVDLTDTSAGNVNYKNLNPGMYEISRSGYSELMLSFAINRHSCSSLEFKTNYTHSDRIYVRKTIDSNRISGQWKPLAWYSDIPTKTSQLTNDSGFLTQHQSLANYVTLNTAQEITGAKTFTNKVYIKLSDATLKIYEVAGSAGSSNGAETMCLQTCFDKQDPLESNYVTQYPLRAVLALQPRGGSVGIGTASPKQALEVVGNIQMSSTATSRTPKIVIDEYYNGTNNWKSEIASDFWGMNVCTEEGFKHGLFITLGRNLTFSNLNVLDADKAPIARISKVLGHWFDGTLTATGDILTTEGLLQSSSNGKTIKIGSQNESFCHYETTAPCHYFNKPVRVNGNLIPHGKLVSTLGLTHLPWDGVFSKVIELKNENDKITRIYSEAQSSTVTGNAQTVIQGGNFTHKLVLKDSYAGGCNYATLEGGYTREGSLTLKSFNADTTNNTASIKAITKISTEDSSFAGPVTIKGYCLSITNTSGNQYILMGNQNVGGTNKPSIIRAANGYTYIGYGDNWSSNTGGTYNSICTFNPDGSVTAKKFIKSGSSSEYVLLGNGDHKALSEITSSSDKLTSTNIITDKTFTGLTNASWTDTGYEFDTTETATYAIQLTSTNLIASGIMSIYNNLEDSTGDEIPLHVYGTAGWRPYLRTNAKKLQISCNDITAPKDGRKVTIKIARII